MFKMFNPFKALFSTEQDVVDHVSKTVLQMIQDLGLDEEAVVTQLIEPGKTGRVKFQGTWWNASCQQGVTLSPGQIVRVIGLCNITLCVEPTEIYINETWAPQI